MKAAASLIMIVMIAALAAGSAACARDQGAARHSARIDALRASVPDKGRKEALGRVAGIFGKARFHTESIEEIAEAIALSEKNLDVLVYAAELVSTVSFHTLAIMETAFLASEAELELPEFRDLVELAVLRSGGYDELAALAERAARVASGEEVAELRRDIAAMREGAAWKTVGEAVAAVEEQQADIERAIRERLRRTR